ncbi:MAG: hypothetical protein OXC07_01615 [Kistimonas sp.]|nr:hypothetical protein [Kistimonas sp.]
MDGGCAQGAPWNQQACRMAVGTAGRDYGKLADGYQPTGKQQRFLAPVCSAGCLGTSVSCHG